MPGRLYLHPEVTPEAAVTKSVMAAVSVLEQRGLAFAARTNSGVFRVLGMGETDLSKSRVMKTGREGWPDITLVVKGGTFVGVEVKAPGGTQSAAQREVQKIVEGLGGTYVLARSRHDFERAVWPLVGLEIPRTVESIMEDSRRELEEWTPTF